jgi:hypothetical protein
MYIVSEEGTMVDDISVVVVEFSTNAGFHLEPAKAKSRRIASEVDSAGLAVCPILLDDMK